MRILKMDSPEGETRTASNKAIKLQIKDLDIQFGYFRIASQDLDILFGYFRMAIQDLDIHFIFMKWAIKVRF